MLAETLRCVTPRLRGAHVFVFDAVLERVRIICFRDRARAIRPADRERRTGRRILPLGVVAPWTSARDAV